jgi:Glucose-6-phosphate dehydrogenase subunit C-terminal domain/Glucose-6-phosphate dehydrogenase subunit N-terminal domain
VSTAATSGGGGGAGGDGDGRLADFEAGRAIEVAPAKIERELDALWRAEASRAKQPVTRACLWNLILTARGYDDFRAAKQLVDDLSAQLPTRAIVLHVDDAGGDELRAFVEANWRRFGGGVSGSDEVTLAARGGAVDRLPALVRALVLPDVPTALFARGPLDRVRPFVDEVDRLIVDSRRFADEHALGALHASARALPRLELADLAWLGVAPLRGLAASLFDPPRDPAVLTRLDRVTVTSGVSGTQSRALLALGWFASRLGWRAPRRVSAPAGARAWRAQRPDGGAVDVVLRTDTGSSTHGVAGIELEAGGESWSLTRHRCIEVRAPGLPDRAQPARSHTDAELAVAALGPRGRDPVYAAALAAAVALVDAKEAAA